METCHIIWHVTTLSFPFSVQNSLGAFIFFLSPQPPHPPMIFVCSSALYSNFSNVILSNVKQIISKQMIRRLSIEMKVVPYTAISAFLNILILARETALALAWNTFICLNKWKICFKERTAPYCCLVFRLC